ncbi:hypothetical protein CR513_15959, partial [Mucuna pruriens]
MVTIFIDTLPSPYYDRIVGNVASNFTDLVVVAPEITNIAGAGGMTRSGRIFAPKALRNKDLAPAKKERIIEPPKKP